jgi:hypothetical protein
MHIVDESRAWAVHHPEPHPRITTLHLFQVLERRITLGLALLYCLNDESMEKMDEYIARFTAYESLVLTPYTVERCTMHRLADFTRDAAHLMEARARVLDEVRKNVEQSVKTKRIQDHVEIVD